jgi:hypothetical protein
MKPESDHEQIREDLEARQRNILWEDGQQNAWRIRDLLWNRHPELRPPSIVFAFLFLFLAIGILAIAFLKDLEGGAFAAFIVAAGLLFLSYKLFSQAFSSRKAARSKGQRTIQ